MKRFALFIAFLTASSVFLQPSNAQEIEHTLSDFQLGEHVSGDKRKLSKLDGKVVVIEYWGTR
jgi:hypothetical protein